MIFVKPKQMVIEEGKTAFSNDIACSVNQYSTINKDLANLWELEWIKAEKIRAIYQKEDIMGYKWYVLSKKTVNGTLDLHSKDFPTKREAIPYAEKLKKEGWTVVLGQSLPIR